MYAFQVGDMTCFLATQRLWPNLGHSVKTFIWTIICPPRSDTRANSKRQTGPKTDVSLDFGVLVLILT